MKLLSQEHEVEKFGKSEIMNEPVMYIRRSFQDFYSDFSALNKFYKAYLQRNTVKGKKTTNTKKSCIEIGCMKNEKNNMKLWRVAWPREAAAHSYTTRPHHRTHCAPTTVTR